MRLGNCLNKTKTSFKNCSKYLVWNCKEHWTVEEGAAWGRHGPLREQDPDPSEKHWALVLQRNRGWRGSKQIVCLFKQVKLQTAVVQAGSSRCWLRRNTERSGARRPRQRWSGARAEPRDQPRLPAAPAAHHSTAQQLHPAPRATAPKRRRMLRGSQGTVTSSSFHGRRSSFFS